MIKYLRYCIAVLTLFIVHDGFAQVFSLESPASIPRISKDQFSSFNLFIHTDKNIYTKNEHIWFSGYLSGDSTSTLSNSRSLIVMIKDEYNRKIQQGHFLMADGFSFGCLELSDTIPPGNYRFIAHTDVVNVKMEPLAYFESPFKIRSAKSKDVSLSSKLTHSGAHLQTKTFQVSATDADGLPIKGASVTYIYDKNEINAGSTDKDGQITFTVDNLLAATKKSMLVKVRSNGLHYLRISLQAEVAPKVNVEFYPEGEQPSTDLLNTISWMAKNELNEPLQVKCVLLENDVPIDTVETKSYGIGRFSFIQVPNAKYKLKLLKDGISSKDTLYNLPEARVDGITLRMKKAVVNDRLSVSITSRNKRQVNLRIHQANNIFAETKLLLQPLLTKNLKIDLQEVPIGVNTLSLTDSLNKPLISRNFFAISESTIKPKIVLSKSAYRKKEQVDMQLMLKDPAGKALEGVVSIACVQKNRIYEYITNNIEAYKDLIPSLGKIPINLIEGVHNNEEYLEDLLSVSSLDSVEQTANSTLKLKSMAVKTIEYQGYVSRFNKPLKKSIKLTIVRDSILSTIETQQDGTFFLAPESMIMPYGREILIFVNEKNKKGYDVQLKLPDFYLKDLEERYPTYSDHNIFGFANENHLEGQTVFDGTNQLKEVVIKGKKNGSIADNFSASYKGNSCGDYIAICNGLNCLLPGHNYERKAPVKGKTYVKHIINNNVITSNIPVFYAGCTDKPKSYVFTFDGVYTTKEYDGIINPDTDFDTGYLSTLVWNPGVFVQENGLLDFSFFTGNLPGDYIIVVNGLTSKGPVHIEKEFSVK